MQRKPRKKNKKYTIMVLPHSNTTPSSINIPMWLINGLATFGLVSLLVVSYLVYSYYNLQETIVENEELKTVNSIQAKEINKLQKSTAEALSKLEIISQTDAKIRELVGLKDKEDNKEPARSQGGLGTQGRNIQTFAIRDIDLMNSLENNSPETSNENSITPTSGLNSINEDSDLQKIEEIKHDLVKINKSLEDQEEILEKLEVDVKNRLDYLAAIPSGWPIRGRITSDYGWRRNPFNRSSWEFHDGLDIAASYGTKVKAAGEGVVIFAGWKPVYGRTVIIRHGYGYTSQYGHNSSLTVKVGQKVKRGDIIARVGSTGRSTGPHVDFRITYNGRWIDPEEILIK